MIRRDRPHGRGGGVCILVRKGINFIEIAAATGDTEVVAVDFVGNECGIRLVCCYASPTGTTDVLRNRISAITGVLDELCACEYPIVIVGDFNLPGIFWSSVTASALLTSKVAD